MVGIDLAGDESLGESPAENEHIQAFKVGQALHNFLVRYILLKGLSSSNLTNTLRKYTTLLSLNTDMFRHLHMPSSV